MAKERELAGAKQNHLKNPCELRKKPHQILALHTYQHCREDLHERVPGALRHQMVLESEESVTLAHPGVDNPRQLCTRLRAGTGFFLGVSLLIAEQQQS